MQLNDKVSITKIFSIEEIKNFAVASGDTNPIHLDEGYAEQTAFGKPIVQGMLVSSLFGGLLGSKLPGNGTIYLGQNLKFLKPNFVGDEVRAVIELTHIREDKPIYTFSTKCYNSKGELTIDGEAVIMYKENGFNTQ